MPGLFGLVCRDPTHLPVHLERMGQALHAGHEQAQDRWVNQASGAALGRESLGTFDPTPQPVSNAAGTLAVLLEGELFDTQDLRRELAQKGYPAMQASDAELALYLFESGGGESLARLHGIFALAIWDRQNRQLTLASDRFGLRPLYYTHRPGLFAFAGEVKGLLAIDDVSREIDDGAVADFFAFGYALGNKTFFREIHLLPPATVLTTHDGIVHQHTYWSLEYAPVSPDRPDEAWVEEATHLLSQAVARRLQKGLTVGLPLSGGLDSRTLLAVTTQALGVSLPTYTYGLPGSWDISRAQQVAQMVDVPHRALHLAEDYPSAYAERNLERTEGLANCLLSHPFALHAMVKECQVMMLGNGGDSFFYVYRSYRHRSPSTITGDLSSNLFDLINRPFSAQQAARLFNETYYRRLKGRALASLESALAELSPNTVDNIYDAYHLREHQRRSRLQALPTITHRLEYAEPYYDYDLVDLALQIPQHLRWNRKIHRLVLARISPELALLPTGPAAKVHGLRRKWGRRWQRLRRLLGRLGITWQSRPKPGSYDFTALSYLLRTANRSWVEEVLLSPRTLERDYFRPQTIQQLVKDHMSGRRNLTSHLGVLLTFELWHRRFLD